jgi:hypothetical protein
MLSEDICKLFLGWHMYQIYVSLFHIISQKVISHVYVFGFGMEHWIFGNAYGTGATTQERDVGALLTKITLGIGDPKQLGTTTSSSNVLNFGGRLGYTRLLTR